MSESLFDIVSTFGAVGGLAGVIGGGVVGLVGGVVDLKQNYSYLGDETSRLREENYELYAGGCKLEKKIQDFLNSDGEE